MLYFVKNVYMYIIERDNFINQAMFSDEVTFYITVNSHNCRYFMSHVRIPGGSNNSTYNIHKKLIYEGELLDAALLGIFQNANLTAHIIPAIKLSANPEISKKSS
jgi:hypothetical protein